MNGNNSKIYSNSKNKSYLGKTLTVLDIHFYILPPFRNKPRDSAEINDPSNSIKNTEQNKLLGKTAPLQNNGKKCQNISYGRTYKSTQRQYDPKSNNPIFDTTTKTTVLSSNISHDQINTPNPNINWNYFYYFLSPTTVEISITTVEDPTCTTNSENNNTVQEATDDPI